MTTPQSTPGSSHTVTFTESGLPDPRVWFEFWTWLNPTRSWSVTVAGETKSSTSATIAFALQGGSYDYSVATVVSSDSAYAPQPSSGSLTVSQSNVTLNIKFERTLAFSVLFQSNTLWGGYDLAVGLTPSTNPTGGSLIAMNGSMANTFLQVLANQLHGEGFSTPISYLAAVEPADFLNPPPLTATGPTDPRAPFTRLSALYSLAQVDSYSPVVRFGEGGPAITGNALDTPYVLNYDLRQLSSSALRDTTASVFSPFLTASWKSGESDLFNNATGSDTISLQMFSPDFVVGPGQELVFLFHGLSKPSTLLETLTVQAQFATIPISASHPTVSVCQAAPTNSCHVFALVAFTIHMTISDNYWWWQLFGWLGVRRYTVTVT